MSRRIPNDVILPKCFQTCGARGPIMEVSDEFNKTIYETTLLDYRHKEMLIAKTAWEKGKEPVITDISWSPPTDLPSSRISSSQFDICERVVNDKDFELNDSIFHSTCHSCKRGNIRFDYMMEWAGCNGMYIDVSDKTVCTDCMITCGRCCNSNLALCRFATRMTDSFYMHLMHDLENMVSSNAECAMMYIGNIRREISGEQPHGMAIKKYIKACNHHYLMYKMPIPLTVLDQPCYTEKGNEWYLKVQDEQWWKDLGDVFECSKWGVLLENIFEYTEDMNESELVYLYNEYKKHGIINKELRYPVCENCMVYEHPRCIPFGRHQNVVDEINSEKYRLNNTMYLYQETGQRFTIILKRIVEIYAGDIIKEQWKPDGYFGLKNKMDFETEFEHD